MPPRMFCVLQMTSAVTCIVGLYNAALFKPAVQIDTYMTDEAYKAVDGNNDSNAFHGYCQITLQHKVPWWMVDLRGQFTVEQVRITNRQDNWVYGMRLQNFDIDVFEQDPRQLPNFPDISGHVCYHQTSAPGLGTFTYNCTAPIVGRYVRLVLRLQVDEYLNVCEIEVFVSSSSSEEIYFNRKEDTQMTGVVPSATLTFSDANYCLQECLSRRSSYYYCTAFNWVTPTRSCQLFSVNTYILQTVNLIGAPGTHFYSQNNLLL